MLDPKHIFISWSGVRSKAIATSLGTFLSRTDRRLEPWVSHKDIAAGSEWRAQLNDSLKSASSAIVCVTPAALQSDWVLFETGVLSSSERCERLIPYLIDVKSRVSGPLSDFQSVHADMGGTWSLVVSLCAPSPPSAGSALRKKFDKHWPKLAQAISDAPHEEYPVDARNFNLLDQNGLLSLLEIYFLASADKLTHIFAQALQQLTDEHSEPNFALAAMRASTALNEGRAALAPFRTQVLGSLPQFLDECLPAATLESILREGYSLISECRDTVERNKAIFGLIRKEQGRLRRIVIDRLSHM